MPLQLACNLAWNWCFFKLRNPSLSLKCVSLYLGLICATTITFHWTLPTAAVLLMPVLGWAIVLFTWNHSVWRNNREGKPNSTLRTLVQKVQQRQADYLGKALDLMLSSAETSCPAGTHALLCPVPPCPSAPCLAPSCPTGHPALLNKMLAWVSSQQHSHDMQASALLA